MDTAHRTHLATSLMKVFRLFAPNRTAPEGPLPKWMNDPQLSQQLYRDTGLSPEDLGGRPTYQEDLPFFMQKNYW